ncbi:cupin domain-containing protein [Glaciimonas sp. PAMC28666]|uniref:cupin domain-containing protein n=1 Tax=Glaciimonas sp. PAMC28666 TaxID=2807626 RepID=UPI0019654E90|nr:cupin domain-containing protein [Glaciimonas sp. PAMC28666]QRX81332.1 cupin [Glaciimonas sp. PAMC28666]
MDQTEFKSIIAREGFAEGLIVDRDSNGFLDTHVHPFEAKALILTGELRMRVGKVEQVYTPGSVFHLLPNVPHAENYGPEGVRYLVGRKEPT